MPSPRQSELHVHEIDYRPKALTDFNNTELFLGHLFLLAKAKLLDRRLRSEGNIFLGFPFASFPSNEAF